MNPKSSEYLKYSATVVIFTVLVFLLTGAAGAAPAMSGWGDPVQVNGHSPSILYAGGPVLVVQNSTTYGVWQEEHQDEQRGIYFSRSNGGGWSTSERVNPEWNEGAGSHAEAIWVDPENEAFIEVVWHSDSRSFLSRSENGGQTWTPTEISPPGWGKALFGTDGTLYVAWLEYETDDDDDARVMVSGSRDGGQSWSAAQVATTIPTHSECFEPEWNIAAGDGQVAVASWGGCGSGFRISASADRGASWSVRYTENSEHINNVALTTVGGRVHVAWFEGTYGPTRLSYWSDTGSGEIPLTEGMSAEAMLDISAAENGRVIVGWVSFIYGGARYLNIAESEDNGQSWSNQNLGVIRNYFDLAMDAVVGIGAALWEGAEGNAIMSSWGSPPREQIISSRYLNSQSLGVVGFVDLDEAASAELRLEREGTTLAAIDTLPLAAHNAPGGGQNQTVTGTLGIWSAALQSDTELSGQEEVVLAVTDANGEEYLERLELPAPPSGHRLEIKSIEREGNNTAHISGIVDLNPPPEGIVGVRVSRWLPATPDTGLPWPGHWSEATDGVIAVNGQWSVTREAFPGENLYRAQVDGYPGLEDVEGYYAVAAGEGLATGEDHDRRQALVFRDAVREVIGNNKKYTSVFPEQLILAIGASENSAFDNGIANTDGIMQVTCYSGHKGMTDPNANTCNPNTEPHTDPYEYMATATSIKFNVSDALLLLYNNYTIANGQDVKYPKFLSCEETPAMPIPTLDSEDDPKRSDALITAVLYYNGGGCYAHMYKDTTGGNPWYLHYAARQLNPQPDDPAPPNLTPDYPNKPQKNGWRRLPGTPEVFNVAQFMGDADYTGGIGEPSDLIERLDHGQNYVNQLLLQQ